MNEISYNNASSTKNICRACLKTSDDLSPMIAEHRIMFKNIVDKMTQAAGDMMLCAACRWMFHRFTKFGQQCVAANNMLEQLLCTDSKSLKFLKHLTTSHDIKQTDIDTYYFGPYKELTSDRCNIHYAFKNEDTVDDEVTSNRCNVDYTFKNEDTVDDELSSDCCNVHYTLKFEDTVDDERSSDRCNVHSTFKDEDTFDDDTNIDVLGDAKPNADVFYNPVFRNCDEESTKIENEDTLANDTLCSETNDVTLKNETCNDDTNEDEKPLFLLSKSYSESGKKKKKKKSKKYLKDQINLDGDTKGKLREHGKSKNTKKELKDGFTSRMRQETDEYIVVKLSRDQVLQEMEQRSKSESYLRAPHKCGKCVKGYNFEDVLRTHMKKHSAENGAFQCEMCAQHCPSAVSLRGHIKSHTTRYKCKLCGHTRISRQHLLEHHALAHTSAAPAYKCDSCHFTTDKRTVMQRHVRSHSGARLACAACGKLFRTAATLRVHTARHDKSARLKCSQCGRTFVYQSELTKHILYVHVRKDYYCVECDVQFKSAESLRLHFKKAKRHRDASDNKHACPQCEQRFFTHASLAAHATRAHAAPALHACSLCRRAYSSGDALRAHVWRAHPNGRHKKKEEIQSNIEV